MKSIRSYLLGRLLWGALAILLVAGIVVYLVSDRAIEAQFDRNLSDRIQGFASILFQDTEEEVEFEFSDELMPEYDDDVLPAYFELWYEDGRLLERSNSLGERDLAVAVAPSDEPRFWTAPLPDGRRGRYVARIIEVHHVYPEEGPDRPTAARVRVVVARGLEALAASKRTVLGICAVVGLAVLFLIGFLSWTAVEKALGPTNRLAAKLDAIEVNALPDGLDVGELPCELRPIARTTDALIRRVDDALRRERRTTADIAHELRTPISELIMVSEVALRNGHDAEAKQTLGTVRDVAWRMGNSLSTLLKLARLEMGAESFARIGVDLTGTVRELLRSLAQVCDERDLRVECSLRSGTVVEGDPEVLRIIASNLLSNAVHYAPPGGLVRCRFEDGPAGWSLVVENESEDLRAEDLRSLTEPFWRKDSARADRERFGLGLALSRALAERTGLALAFELEARLFRARLAERAGQREPDRT